MHWRSNDTALASDWFVAKVVNKILFTIDLGISNLDCILKFIEQLEISFLEYVRVWVLINSWSKPNSVDSEKRSKLVLEIVLLKVSS